MLFFHCYFLATDLLPRYIDPIRDKEVTDDILANGDTGDMYIRLADVFVGYTSGAPVGVLRAA